MKKLMTILLAFALLATLPMTAFAAENSEKAENGGSVSINMTGRYESGGNSPEIVSVDVAWGSMDFTYTSAGVEWDPVKHQNVATDAGWTNEGNDISVTNHSNISITANLGFTTDMNVTGKFYDAETGGSAVESVTLNRAAVGSERDSQKQTVYFVIESGEITESVDKLGSITVTINGHGKTEVNITMASNAKTEYTYGVDTYVDVGNLVEIDAGLTLNYKLVSGPAGDGILEGLDGQLLTFGDCGTYYIEVTTEETDVYKAGKLVLTITFKTQTDWDGEEIPVS